MVDHASTQKNSRAGTSAVKSGPVEVAHLHRPDSPEVTVAREVARLDREVLSGANRSDHYIRAGSIMGVHERPDGALPNVNQDVGFIGLQFRMSFGDPKGENEFNADVTGLAGVALSGAKAIADRVGGKPAQVMDKLDVNGALNSGIAKATGWKHNAQLETRSGEEIRLTDALGRVTRAEKWAVAAKKEHFAGYEQGADVQVNAARYVEYLNAPMLEEFKKKHPGISSEHMKVLKREAMELLLGDHPYATSGIVSGLKKLFLQSPSTTPALENGRLSVDVKTFLLKRLSDTYNDLKKG